MKIQLILLSVLAAVFADSSTSNQRVNLKSSFTRLTFHSVDNILDLKELQTFKTWRKPTDVEVKVYLRPLDETEPNRDEFMEKFTVGSEIFNQLLLINSIVNTDIIDDLQEIPLNVNSDILQTVLNFASWYSENQIELISVRYLTINKSNIDIKAIYSLLNAANYIHFEALISVCIKTIVQKLDLTSIKDTVKLDRSELLNHASCIKRLFKYIAIYRRMTLEAIIDQLERQYQIAPDMTLLIYKSIPLSKLVQFKAPAKIIGLFFIAYTSKEAYTTNNAINLSLESDTAESIGYSLIESFKKKTSISRLLPEIGYKLDDEGNKQLLSNEDILYQRHYNSDPFFISASTHPYVFEFIWSIYQTANAFKNFPTRMVTFGKSNRKDLLEIVYNSIQGLEEAIRFKQDLFSQELGCAIKFGNVLVTEYLLGIGTLLATEYLSDIGSRINLPVNLVRSDGTFFSEVFKIKDFAKMQRFLNYLYHQRTECAVVTFDREAIAGNLENVQWLVEHGYKGRNSRRNLRSRETISDRQQVVLDYLSANPNCMASRKIFVSRGNFAGEPQPF